MKNYFCPERVSFRQTRKGPRPMHARPQGKSALCVQRADWRSDHSHSQRSDVDQAERVSETRTTSQDNMWEDDVNSYSQPTKVCGDNNDLRTDMTLTTAQGGLAWDSMEGDFVTGRHSEPTRPMIPTTR